MTRIAYVSHVSSRWIRQRPHFLAEALRQADGVRSVTYVCSALSRDTALVHAQELSVPVLRLPLWPQRLRRMRVAHLCSSVVSAILLAALVRPTVVFVTHPRFVWLAWIMRRIGCAVFYDHMDRNIEFSDATAHEREAEERLYRISSGVICSSGPLMEDVAAVAGAAPTLLVPNALALMPEVPDQSEAIQARIAVYVGTISEWFDFAAVLHLLEQDECQVVLIGPADVPVPHHPRLLHRGPIDHEEAQSAMRSADVLIMPFKVTRLIEAVDPVKLYEYIATGRPTVSVDYAQVHHFGAAVHLYNTREEFAAQVRGAWGRPSRRLEARQSFARSNTWRERSDRIMDFVALD